MSQICSQCNAPLPLGPVGTIAKCAYCGVDTRIIDEVKQIDSGAALLDAALKARLDKLIKIATPKERAEHYKQLADEKALRDAQDAEGPRFANRVILAVCIVFAICILMIGIAIARS